MSEQQAQGADAAIDLNNELKARREKLAALREQVDECQRQAIRAALQAHPGNWAAAARLLQLDPSNLRKLARRLGVQAV